MNHSSLNRQPFLTLQLHPKEVWFELKILTIRRKMQYFLYSIICSTEFLLTSYWCESILEKVLKVFLKRYFQYQFQQYQIHQFKPYYFFVICTLIFLHAVSYWQYILQISLKTTFKQCVYVWWCPKYSIQIDFGSHVSIFSGWRKLMETTNMFMPEKLLNILFICLFYIKDKNKWGKSKNLSKLELR